MSASGLPAGRAQEYPGSGRGSPRHSAGRVSVVATIGYVAFLAGPPLIGLLGNQAGVLRALTVTAGLLAVGLLVAGATRPLVSADED